MKQTLSYDWWRSAIFCFLTLWAAGYPAAPVQGQDYLKKENNNWVFGERTGIHFSSGAPVSITSSMKTREAAASVSDPAGNLLFYTDGTTVWDHTGSAMPNGTVLTGLRRTEPVTSSSSYGAAIIPIPGSPSQYYIFSVTKLEMSYEDPALYGRLYYSIIDMRLNNGRGDVISKGNLLDTNLQEKIAGVVGDGCYNWLIAHDQDSAMFKSWRITPRGLDPQPVLSRTGSVPTSVDYCGIILPSPDREKLVIVQNGTGGSNTQIHDFDAATGIIGNVLFHAWTAGFWAAFSPNSQILYIAGAQIDLSTSPPSVFAHTANGDLKLGPDGKIYFFSGGASGGYGIIHAPDVFGPNAWIQILPVILPFAGNAYAKQFSNTVPVIETDTLTSYQKICATDSALLIAADTAGLHYQWLDTLEGHSRIVHETGTYVLRYFLESACAYVYDTFEFQKYTIPDLGPDTILCTGQSIILRAGVEGASLRWQNNRTADSLVVDQPGLYIVEADINGCVSSDSVHIRFTDLEQDLGSDHELCNDQSVNITLEARGPEDAGFLWQDGSTGSTFTARDSGTYWVDVRLAECQGSDTVHISIEICDCSIFLPNAFTPNGDGRNDIFKALISTDCPVSEYRMDIYNRWGALVYSTTVAGEGWDGLHNGMIAETGTYMYHLSLKAGSRRIEKYFKGDLLLIR